MNVEYFRVYNNLGIIYSDKKMYSDARYHFLKCLKILEWAFKDSDNNNYIDLADTYTNLGSICKETNDFKAAIYYFEEGLKIKEGIYEKEYLKPLSLAHAYTDLGEVYRLEGTDLDKALHYHIRSLEIEQIIFDNTDNKDEVSVSILYSLSIICDLYYNVADYDAIINYYEESLEKQREIYSDKVSLEVAMAFNNLASAYYSKNRLFKAVEYYVVALKTLSQLSEPTYEQIVVSSLEEIARIFAKSLSIDSSETHAIAIELARKGKSFIDYMEYYKSARKYMLNNQLEEAIKEFELSLKFCPKSNKDNYAILSYNLACMYHVAAIHGTALNNNYYLKAEEFYRLAIQENPENIDKCMYIDLAHFF